MVQQFFSVGVGEFSNANIVFQKQNAFRIVKGIFDENWPEGAHMIGSDMSWKLGQIVGYNTASRVITIGIQCM